MAEPLAFRAFVQCYSGELQRMAWMLTGDWAAAEDLVQEALIAAWPHWEGLTRPDTPQLYVRKVMVRSFVRGRKRRWVGEMPTATVPDRVAYSATSTDIDLREALRVALGKLPTRQRAVLALRYFADLSEADTAKILGCSVGTVKAHSSKAMASLRKNGGLAGLLTEGVS
jgi:RNA polymerase sigma-70 factor (sigma-E family)